MSVELEELEEEAAETPRRFEEAFATRIANWPAFFAIANGNCNGRLTVKLRS